MKDFFKGLGVFLIVVVVFLGLTYGFGWFGVGYTKTVGKSQKNAEREVFEQTNSFVKGKKQEIIKYYKEYLETESKEEKKAIETVLSMSLADFDEDKYIHDRKLLSFVKKMKY